MYSAITAIGTANPPIKRAQEDIAELISDIFHLDSKQKKVLKRIYKGSGIEHRHSVIMDYSKIQGEFDFFPNDPTADFPSTAQRMALYKSCALPLAIEAINDCLINASNVDKKQITHLITVSCTGMYAPGIDIEILQQLALASSTKRTSINFMGCYGAFNGMKVADAICRADPQAKVLVVCIELCSIHIQKGVSLDNIISNAIFADGAAAILIEQPKLQKHFRFESFYCDIVPQTSSDMAWHIGDFGFDMVLSAYVPDAIKLGISAFAKTLLSQPNLSFSDIDFFAIHPGGLKILQACEASLNIAPEDNRFSYDVLRQYGNMSSATVLFVLKQIWNIVDKQDDGKTLFSCAFGPGLTLESMLLSVHL